MVNKLNYSYIGDVIKIDYQNGMEFDNVYPISSNTQNTWQKSRDFIEKVKNTKQGKIAEFIVGNFFKMSNNLKYIDYDSFRKDNYKKNAPFDGLLCLISNPKTLSTNKLIELINENIKDSPNGKLNENTKSIINSFGFKTIEIKSTKVNERKRLNSFGNDRVIISNILKDDFLTYPYFIREGFFKDYFEYCRFVSKDKSSSDKDDLDIIKNITKIEFEQMSDVHIRIYIDDISNKAFIIGYIDKSEFFSPYPNIKKMVQFGKSENAIYFSTPLKKAKPILEIENDKALWK
jgi:hypothetical protein